MQFADLALMIQFHLLMTSNATKALVLYPGNSAVNLALVSTLYMVSAYTAFQASVSLQASCPEGRCL